MLVLLGCGVLLCNAPEKRTPAVSGVLSSPIFSVAASPGAARGLFAPVRTAWHPGLFHRFLLSFIVCVAEPAIRVLLHEWHERNRTLNSASRWLHDDAPA